LDGSEWVVAAGPARLIRILAQAVEGPIKVAGKEYNNPGMLAWGNQLKPEELAAVITYIRQAWSNKASAVTVDQIKAVLQETKGREAKWTVAELEKVPEALGGGGAAELTPEQLRDKLKALPPEKLKELLKDLPR
jgi:ABC-type cobalamin/Fe3+-siderophores transport system ATPase subunit